MKSKLNFITSEHGTIKADLLSGLTVALALVPEAVAFAFVAGISERLVYMELFISSPYINLWR